MGTSWAVGAAMTLALVAWVAPGPAFAFPPIGPPEPSELIHWLVGIAAIATWAYAIAMAAHGNKGALAALLANVGAAFAAALVWLAKIGFGAAIALLALVAAVSIVAIAGELRSRRGGVQWGAAIVYAIPTVALVVWEVTLVLQPVTR